MADEPGQPMRRWMREYRNSTGLITYPGLFYSRRVMPTSTAALRHFLNNSTIYIKPEQTRRAARSILAGGGLLTAEGEMHTRQRKVLNPAFAVGYIREIVPRFWEKATDLADVLQTMVATQPPEGIEVFRQLGLATLDIIGSAGCVSSFHILMKKGSDMNSILYIIRMIHSQRLMRLYLTSVLELHRF
jgi:cytochrome P450